MGTKVVCWNIARINDPWRELAEMDADVALLQEAGKVPEDVASKVQIGPPNIGTLTIGTRSGTKTGYLIWRTVGQWW